MEKTTRIGVDVGGTFTDLVLHDDVRSVTVTGKLPTTPDAPGRAIVAGIQRLLYDSGTSIAQVGSIVHGTTLITNTILERSGASVGLMTTDGFRDLLEMGREIRYDIENLSARPAPVLVPRHRRIGVGGRMKADGTEHAPLDEAGVLAAARHLVDDHGIDALAIAFLHSYANPRHELRARELIQIAYPQLLVTLSAEVAPEIREYERITTACANAYVQPGVHGYLDRLEADLAAIGFDGQLRIMLSSGGITTVRQAKSLPIHLLESGPAAGAIAAAFLARAAGENRVISFDMGGTTAKMCLIEDGLPKVKHDFEAGRLDRFKPGSGLPLKLTVVDMIEIGSGGGSIAALDRLGLMTVGPRSAGAVPGPVAYGRGGREPTVTDCDLLLGYLDPRFFLGGELNLSVDAVEHSIGTHLAQPLGLNAKQAATGVQDVATENMAAATRMHLAEKGRDPHGYALMAFGGAGPVHAYALAKRLKIRRVIVPVGAGVISAYGFLIAAATVHDVRGYAAAVDKVDWTRVSALYAEMETHARKLLATADGRTAEVTITRSVDMRYHGQGFEIEMTLPDGVPGRAGEPVIRDAFAQAYRATYGRTVRDGIPEMINWRLSGRLPESDISLAYRSPASHARRGSRLVNYLEFGELETAVYDRYALAPATSIRGPALFEEHDSSCAFGPDCRITVDTNLNLIADFGGPAIHAGRMYPPTADNTPAEGRT